MSSRSTFSAQRFTGIITYSIPRRVQTLTDAKIEFGLIPKADWFQPSWIDEDRATESRKDMEAHNVIYGGRLHECTLGFVLMVRVGSVPYRNMCRFNSGVSFVTRNIVSIH